MIIKSVKLRNIRSYVNADIRFPLGSTLLAGDIGSGKSSILLAIEFALFGAKRGLLPAYSLLRHGKNEGYVELMFELEGKEVIIKRSLKRAKDEIKQDTGYIIINDKKKEATAVELKSVVLDLLGYPKELLTKSKDLLYRYTVYTPQEEMKQILLEDKDIRLDTLRKVFNIDKYKKIRENTETFTKRLRELSRGFELALSDLESKQKQLKEKQSEEKELETRIGEVKNRLEKIREKVKEKRDEIRRYEEDIKKLNNLKRDIEVSDVELRSKVEQKVRGKADIERLEGQIKLLESELKKKDAVKAGEIEQKEKEITLMEKTIREIQNKISELKININHSREIKNKIMTLDKCPTCEQNVTSEYKTVVEKRENENLLGFEKEHKLFTKQGNEAEEKFKQLRKEIDELKKLERQTEITKIKSEAIDEKRKLIKELMESQERIKKEIGSINKKKMEINEKIKTLAGTEENYKKSKEEFEKILNTERKIEIEKTGFEKEREGVKRYVSDLEKEVNEKLNTKDKLNYFKQLNNWFDKYFINLMNVIERHIMLQVHRQFSELFESWFSILIEDETISVRLDDSFTPIIEQNGYETTVENLSGGERTSVALSYRLALNKVINDIVTDIRTKELIMLDEPTDGFSTEQLDRVRDVLDKLNMKQVIIVSHESKIESFVSNVIRVNKEEHISSIAV